MKYGNWTFGQIEALLNRLGEDNARKLLGCREVTVTFDTADKLATVTAKPRQWTETMSTATCFLLYLVGTSVIFSPFVAPMNGVLQWVTLFLGTAFLCVPMLRLHRWVNGVPVRDRQDR